MYVRVKHQKTTYFISDLTPSSTIAVLKSKLEKTTSLKDTKLFLKRDSGFVQIDENSICDQIGIQDDSDVFCCLSDESGPVLIEFDKL